MPSNIGVSVQSKEAPDKVTGTVKYNNDVASPDLYAHAILKSIDTSRALEVPGVKAVVTGDYFRTEDYSYELE